MPNMSALAKIRAIKTTKKGTKKKLKKPPQWLFPSSAEREYTRDLWVMTNQLKQYIKEFLVPAVPDMIAEIGILTPDGPRGDAWADRLRGIILTIGELMVKPVEEAISEAEKVAEDINLFNYNQFQKINKSVFGIDIFIDQPWLRDQLQLFSRQNAQLITSIPVQELERVAGVVERGLQEGSRFEVIAEDIQKSFGITRRRAKNIARDQTAKLNSSLTKLRQQELGVEEYEWQTAGDERVRPTHRANAGKTFRWDDPPAKTGHPGTDVNCRCVAVPVLEGILDYE